MHRSYCSSSLSMLCSLRHCYTSKLPCGFLQRAIEEGADFIETDILATKDGALICFHDVTLDDTTDVNKHKEFSDRRRTYEVQGTNVTGWFTGMFL